MTEFTQMVRNIKFSSIDSVAAELKNMDIDSTNYIDVLSSAFSLSAYKGRMVVKGLLKATPKFKDRNYILVAVRQAGDPHLRQEVVRAYKESKKDAELITSLSLMTTEDATLFLKDYFKVGGKKRKVTRWLVAMSEVYVKEKRKGNIDPDYDDWWEDFQNTVSNLASDFWDGISSFAGTIAEGITTIVNAMIEAGVTFGEIINDVIGFPQRSFNALIEALIDLGRDIGEFITAVIDKAISAVKKVFKAIIAAGKKVFDILQWIYENAPDSARKSIQVLIAIGCRIKDILQSGFDLALETLKDVVGHIVALGHSVWYILKWAANKATEVIKGVFEKLLEIGRTLDDLVAWCIRRTVEIMKKGFQVLLALGNTFTTIVTTILTNPRNLLKKSFQALKELGATAYDFLKAAADLGINFLKKVYRTLKKIGMTLTDILDFAGTQICNIFKDIVIWLLQSGVKIFEILLWAINQTVQIFGRVLEAADAVLDSFLDIVEWVFSIGGEWLEHLARWVAEKARSAVDWFKNKIILPILAVGKLFLVVALAMTNIVFLAIAYFVLKSLVNEDETDYKNWPDTLDEFKNAFSSKLAILPNVDDTHKYVVVSDVHKESQNDIDGGIGHFHKNKELFKAVLRHYAEDDSWTLITVGDAEEFWYCNDLSAEQNPLSKVEPIIETNEDVFSIISENYYKYQTPRRFIKIRGNHDDIWTNNTAVNKLRRNGFPNLKVYEYAVIPRNGRDILIMHGHQFDPYNCDANNFFGKFCSNFVGESLDVLNEVLVDLFGDDARIEGWALAPFYDRSEWTDMIEEVENPEISSGIMFDEMLVIDQVRRYDCSIILGHTHAPKVMKDSEDPNRFYVNAGTSGWWEHCVWTVEITPEDITLIAWTLDEDNNLYMYRSFKLSEATVF